MPKSKNPRTCNCGKVRMDKLRPSTKPRHPARRKKQGKKPMSYGIDASLVCREYDGFDMLPLDPPRSGETVEYYRRRIGDKTLMECGDTLFAFIIFELCDADGHRPEGASMLWEAVRQLKGVARALTKVPQEEEDEEEDDEDL